MQDNNINIVFFHSRVAGYLKGFFYSLCSADSSVNINVVHWNFNIHLNFKIENEERLKYHNRTDHNHESLYALLVNISPQILVVSGWMDKEYLKAARRYKKFNPNIKVVCGLDDSWRAKPRQIIGAIAYQFLYRSLFDYVWTSGKPQYAYATIWGYPKEKIIQHFASADGRFFNKKANFKKRIVFLGRFSPEKGIENFVEAYESLNDEYKLCWPLTLIGDGPLNENIYKLKSKYINVLPFMEENVLLDELNKGGVFCLPSFNEQWGVVIHEFAILGYPLLLSNICGGTSEFLIENYNGYSFNPNNKESIKSALIRMMNLDIETLNKFSERSHILGNRINTEIAAFSMLAILNK